MLKKQVKEDEIICRQLMESRRYFKFYSSRYLGIVYPIITVHCTGINNRKDSGRGGGGEDTLYVMGERL